VYYVVFSLFLYRSDGFIIRRTKRIEKKDKIILKCYYIQVFKPAN